MVMRPLVFAIAAVLLGACTVGPDYVKPTMAIPARFAATAAPADVSSTPAPEPDVEFWRNFNDATLDRLVEQALSSNNDLRAALSRYDQANALLRNAKFDRFPTITVDAAASDGLLSADQAPGLSRSEREGHSYRAGVNATWELDLFGRVRRSVEAQRANAGATAFDLDALQVAIVGEVASSYVQLRGAQERLRIAQRNAELQQQTLNLVQARLDAGSGTDFDSARARAQLETTLARVPALDAVAMLQMHRLAVLTGQTPDALIGALSQPAALPALPASIDPGTPGTLLRRRPDVIAAEHRLHAATAGIGVATADLFPRFTLGGLLGTQAIDSGNLFQRDSETHLVALGIDWSFLDIGRVRARIAASNAGAQGEVAQYQQTVLLALEDAENALVSDVDTRAEDGHLERAAIDGATAAHLARLRYDAGATDLLEVIDAERTQLQAQDAFADARTRSVLSAVSLYKALAGGWPTRVPQRLTIAEGQSRQ
jgi:multidrug efflux system outer membrane protein